jgi:RNA polymerase sigma factor (sigma-70 family)
MTDYVNFTDEQLVTACRSGDEKAWDSLVARYERLVYTVPARYGLTPGEVDDVFQSVWLSLVKNLDKLREPDRVSAWLVTTARRECWERRRGADYERSVASDLDTILTDTAGDGLSPEEVVNTYSQYQTLQLAVKQLGDRCQRLLLLLYYDTAAPSYAEVADTLDMPIGSIGPMRARCLKKLRGLLININGDE